MPLRTCGTVIANSPNRVIVEIQAESCENCNGNCIRFKVPKTLRAEGSFKVGTRVAVVADPLKLTLASLLVFGLPLIVVAGTAFVSDSLFTLSLGIALSVLFVLAATRSGRFKRLLDSRAEELADSNVSFVN